MKIQLNLVFALAFMAQSTFAQETFKAHSISIFKDGNSFVQKRGKVKTKENIYKLQGKDIPPALYGTFWVNTPKENIVQVMSYVDTLHGTKTRSAKTITELFDACKGKEVRLKEDDKNTYEGKLLDVIKTETLQADNQISPDGTYYIQTGFVPIINTILLHLQLKDGSHKYFDGMKIQHLDTKDGVATNIESKTQTPITTLEIGFGDSKAEQDLELMYVQKGLTWLPFYNLELGKNKKAKLELRSEVINGADDINNCELSFVVGTPNFKYANSLSNLVYFLNAQSARGADGLGAMQYNPSNVFAGQVTGNVSGSYNLEASGRNTGIEDHSFNNNLIGDNVQDLYFYKLNNVNLRKGARAHYKIFNTEIDYEHLYECDLVGNQQQQYFTPYYNFDFTPNANSVFHGVRLMNNTNNPFTTGPVMITENKEGKILPIGQDMLKYTSMKGESIIRLTNTNDINVQHAEKETARVERSEKWNGYDWDVITVEAKIKVKNYKKTDCKMEVRRPVYGMMQKSDADWKITNSLAYYYGYYNTYNTIKWDFEVKAGEEKEITYSYKYYFRR